MSFGQRLEELRKKAGMSQEELAAKLGSQRPAIGRYERETAKPTIEVATKISKILGISQDYLVSNTDSELNADTLLRIQQVDKLSGENKKAVYFLLDAFIRDVNTKQAYAS
jgi:transcriptional regulator with XRE-family HTH domain